MIDRLKRHAIQVLRAAGHGQSETATLTDVSVRSVRRVAAEPDGAHVDDAGERDRRRMGRPAIAEPYRPRVVEWLVPDPALLSVEIVRRAKLAGSPGGKSALYDLIHAIRPKTPRPVVRCEGLPGEFTPHDVGQVDVRYLDGTKKRIHVFASRLKYSRWVEVTIVPDEQTETRVRTLVDHFTAIGGIPLLGIDVCWPFSPEQKGSIEHLVGWGKGSFFKQRRVLDDADLLTQLADWRTEVNTPRPCRATRVIPAVRLEEERPRLRPVKVAPAPLALRVPVVVGPTAAVLPDTHPSSMPPDAIGIPGTLFLYRDRVRIVAGRFEAVHQRLFEPSAKSTLPEHRAQPVAAVSGQRAKRYLQREHLLALGSSALDYLTELTPRRPRIWIRDVDRLHELLASEFVTDGRCLILSGKPGRGNTHLAVAIRYRAIQNGFDARFVTAAELIDDLSAAFRSGRLADAWATAIHPGVLIVDEVGYLTYGTDAANMLFHVVNDRHRKKRAMIFTTNKAVTTWGHVLHDEDLAHALVDRILERGRVLTLDGPSLRTQHLGLDDPTSSEALLQPARISGIQAAEFPEPTAQNMNRRLNITLPEQTVRLMDRVAGKGRRSSLIDHAVRRYVKDTTRANLRKHLAESYKANAELDVQLAGKWFPLEDEAWQRGDR